MADHKTKHKHAAPTVQNLRSRQRDTQIEIRKNKRDRKYNAKRVRIEETEKEEPLICLQEIEAACRELVHKGGASAEECLLKLRRAFTQGPEYIDVLFRIDNCLQSLVGILTGSKIELQEQAAWCLTNIATGRSEHVLAIAKAAAPYFITFVSGSSPLLQDQCAWALGNIAGDSIECRQILHSQGCLPPLIKLLESPTPACVRSAAFAISNLIRDLPEIANDAVECGVMPILLQFLQKTDTPPELLCEVGWVVTYLTNSQDIIAQMVSMGFLPIIVDIIVHTAMTGHVQDGEVVTPMLRALGNICSGPDDYSLMACENPRLMPALLRLLECSLSYVAKETVWLMSNMTSDYNVSQSIAYGPILPALLVLLDKGYDVQVEAMYTLCNMASHGETVCTELVSHGAVAKVVPLLKHFDIELLHMAMAFCEAALRYADARFIFEECGGLTSLEQLESHPNDAIQNQALEIMETYFGHQEENDIHD
ncbi:importin subunit alpha-6-like [Littorina saxatilis]|uniref:Importin subunit alpha n=1 Tax=Littorina saxatilis TaxID=31220 RepID=A0AAN9AJS2_9CAEN